MARQTALAALLLLAAVIGASAHTYGPVLAVLGDSLSDNGNTYMNSSRTVPSAVQGYYMGRFSDGEVWSDIINASTSVYIFNTGFAAATACPPSVPNGGAVFPEGTRVVVPHLAVQANTVATESIHWDYETAAFIWMGANDLSLLTQGLLASGANLDAAFEAAYAAIEPISTCILQAAEGLLRYGITRSLTVSTVQNIGLQPIWSLALSGRPELQGRIIPFIGNMTRHLNDFLIEGVSRLANTYTRARVQTFDMYGLYNSLVLDGRYIGLTNTTNACLEVENPFIVSGHPDNNAGARRCPNPASYMFWDYSHPTTATHAIIADKIINHVAATSDIFRAEYSR